MKKRAWAILAVILTCCALFFSFQNFTYKYKVKESSRKPASADDFNSMIEDSQSSQAKLAHELEKAHPPTRVEKKGLINRQAEMKRQVIEGTSETVVAKDSKPFFKDADRKHVDENKDLERLSNEVDSESP